MKKILLLFVLLSCMSVYGENLMVIDDKEIDNTKQEVTNVNNISANWEIYLQKLEQKIKSNWNPPKIYASRRVITILKIAKDGSLIDAKVSISSGDLEADKIAIETIRKNAPYEPLPKEFKGDFAPIEFTFVYNVKFDTQDVCKTKFCKIMQKY